MNHDHRISDCVVHEMGLVSMKEIDLQCVIDEHDKVRVVPTDIGPFKGVAITYIDDSPYGFGRTRTVAVIGLDQCRALRDFLTEQLKED